MEDRGKHESSHHVHLVTVKGKVPGLNAKNLSRISVYLTQGNKVLSASPVNGDGTFHLHVASHLADEASVRAVLAPKGMNAQALATRKNLPQVALSSGRRAEHEIALDFGKAEISNKTIDEWWIWCQEYTVSGTLLTAAGCPIGAQVTVYNVNSTSGGLVETPLATVSTDSNGNFTASFNWCSFPFCWWPCWPIWWDCWPWWWELDMLVVIENLERQIQGRPLETVTSSTRIVNPNVAPLRQPSAADLATGLGFGALHGGVLQVDSQRTALLASKLANPRIRAIFPWWWWCCDDPNIVFSAVQGTTTILDEDPNTSTRWCFESGQTVSLTGSSQSLGACPVGGGGECAFAWTSVGSEPPFAVLAGGPPAGQLSLGYAEGSGACANLGFAGSLNLNGLFSGGCVAYYQVLAGQWGGGTPGDLLTQGNPARGGTPPGAFQSLSQTLYNYVTIWRDATKTTEQDQVKLGPFSFAGQNNLYATLNQRQSGLDPSILAQIGAFPTVVAPDFVIGWAYPDLVLTVPAASLISPALTGGVDLAIQAFDSTGTAINPPSIDLGPNLTLEIDATAPTTTTIDWPTIPPFLSGVFNSDGSPAVLTVEGVGCPAYQLTTPTGYVLLHTTVVDKAGHLGEYWIVADYGAGSTVSGILPSDRDYAQPVSSFTPPSGVQRYGVDAGYQAPNDFPPFPPPPPVPVATNWTYIGGGDTFYIPITQSCCYEFQLWVAKRTTDGETGACDAYIAAFQTVNIVVGP